MNKEKLLAAGIDYDDGLRRCVGDAALYEELLRLIVADTHFQLAKEAVQTQDWDAMFAHCHEIKGMSGTVSFTRVYALSSQVVSQYRANDFAAIPATFEKLEEAYKLAIEAVAAELG